MVSRAPYLLNFSVKRLDNRLCFFQNQLSLSASNVNNSHCTSLLLCVRKNRLKWNVLSFQTRNIVARLPRLLCGSLEPIKENLKVVNDIKLEWQKEEEAALSKFVVFFSPKCHSQVCEIELGFKKNEIQHIVTVVPKVLTANKRKLTEIFDYIHNTMKVPHHLIAKFPQVSVYFGRFFIACFIPLSNLSNIYFYRFWIPSTCVSESGICSLSTLERLSMILPCPPTSLWTVWCLCLMRFFVQMWLRPQWKIFICSKKHFDLKMYI